MLIETFVSKTLANLHAAIVFEWAAALKPKAAVRPLAVDDPYEGQGASAAGLLEKRGHWK